MTRFTRSGHWRTSSSGDTHWVSAHTVDRDVWEGHGALPEEVLKRLALQGRLPHGQRQLAAPRTRNECFMEPNSTCPVCGAPVYFYQNAFGSKVYFDDVGPPWRKHPCTDKADPETSISKTTKAEPSEPRRRQHWATLALIGYYEENRSTLHEMTNGAAVSDAAWLIGRITQIQSTATGSKFVLEIAHGALQRVRRCTSKRLPAWIKDGDAIFASGKSFCIFDLRTMLPVHIEFDLLKS